MSVLELDAVQVEAGGRALFEPVTARIAGGEVLSITGPSGSGKSSLLAFACGILAPELAGHGDVRMDGRSLLGQPPERRRLGILFQDDLLFPHLSVGGNIGFGMRESPRRERARLIDAALESVGLAGFAARDPATLSGGERARVALLRVLLSEPRAVLLDEPFGRLDAPLRDAIRQLVFARCRERGLPVVLVTHDAADVAAAGGRELPLQPVSHAR